MKNLLLLSIWLYQVFFAVLIKNIIGTRSVCRFEETCSQYAKRSIVEHGALGGSYRTLIRMLKCQSLVHF